jgi:hypothetical protein
MRNSPHLLRLALIATMSVVLVACSTPSAEPTPSSTATTSPSASPSPSPSSTPSFDAADTSTWRITEAGIGRAELGSETIADALSPTFALTDRCEGLEYYEASEAASVGFGVISHPGEGGVSGISVRVPGDLPVSGPVATSPLTESGIGLGATLDELTTAEPGGSFEATAESPDYIVGAGTRWFVFEVSEAEPFVRGITVTDTLPATGFCS